MALTITGATSASYTAVEDDEGGPLSVTVSYTDGFPTLKSCRCVGRYGATRN